MLLNKREDMLYVVDELERSLHPKLTERFLQLFMQLHSEERMQLLFTTPRVIHYGSKYFPKR
ncbi:MAG: AAA family ATPase [Lachnospiraceae bacterium]